MKKNSFKLRSLINSNIKIGDSVKLIDGSGLWCEQIICPYIISAYPKELNSHDLIKDIIGKVTKINQEYVFIGDLLLDFVYFHDVEIELNGIKFRTCSHFLKVVEDAKLGQLNSLNNAQNALDNIRKKCIGLFICSNIMYLVLKYDEGHLVCVNITGLGAIQELHIHENEGKYAKIPFQYQSFWHLLQEPGEYYTWYKNSFNKF